MSASAAASSSKKPFNAAEATQWLNNRFRAIEAEALNPSLPPEARPEILKVPKQAGAGSTNAGGTGVWGGSKKQTTNFVADVIKASQAKGSSTTTPASAGKSKS
ncbi:hypothetical protein OC861_005809 [Tilletia horrida]|nr:hypothetical protein OC861_005809 [Tilletia horrida]